VVIKTDVPGGPHRGIWGLNQACAGSVDWGSRTSSPPHHLGYTYQDTDGMTNSISGETRHDSLSDRLMFILPALVALTPTVQSIFSVQQYMLGSSSLTGQHWRFWGLHLG